MGAHHSFRSLVGLFKNQKHKLEAFAMKAISLYSITQILKENYLMLIGVIAGIVGAISALPLSYLSGSNSLIGICLFPLLLFREGGSRFNILYLSAVLIFASLALHYNLHLFYFLTISFYFIFLFELLVAKTNPLILFLIGVMSPVFLQVVTILGFPIRLMLSKWAGQILNATGMKIEVEGNMMTINEFSFSVDEACMGLNMLAVSILMGIAILTNEYRINNIRLTWKYLIPFFLAVFILNIFSNLLRIVILVIFKIDQSHPMHELIGIGCLVLYVMIPLYLLGKKIVRHFGIPIDPTITRKAISPSSVLFILLLGTSILSVGFIMDHGNAQSTIRHPEVTFIGMKQEKIDGGIMKLFNDDLLIYLKPIPEFFSGEHTPLICWKGSGYTFKSIKKESIAGIEIYSGILSKGNSILYTAWWYYNGNILTIDQLTWRMKMLQGHKKFCLVNVTAKEKSILHQQLKLIFENNLMTIQRNP
jgi:exosortase N